ncbi:NUDIX domain-containing protein [Patescibacteria group bacterium]|nr:NUDIX domain-containing protein [Patescibacteria group bacterium]MBU0964140.1 NUDIX domain-containing protein [Patescibacteria group bacterium]
METKLFFAPKAFIIKDGKVLVVRESTTHPTNTHAGEYSLIGGRIKDDEPWQGGFKREVSEEIGADIKIGQPIYVSESYNEVNGEHWHIVRCFFLCQIKNNEIRLNKEHDDFKWIDPKNYKHENLIYNLHAVFEEYLKQ